MAELRSMPKWRVTMMLLAVFLSTFACMGDQALTPVVNLLYTGLEGATEATVNYGITGVCIVALPFILLAGWLCDRIDKKIVLVGGFGMYTVGTVLGDLSLDIVYFDVTRTIVMIGWGVQNVSALAILAAVFTEEDEHGKVVGWYNTAMAILGAIIAFVAGQLAAAFPGDEIHGVFRTYLATIPILVLIILFVPSIKPERKKAAEEQKSSQPAAKGNISAWLFVLVPLALQVFLVAVAQNNNYMMLSMYVADAGIGDAAFVGMLSSMGIVLSAVAGLLFGFVFSKLKKWIAFAAIALVGAGFLIMGLLPMLPTSILSCMLIGFGWPMFYSFAYVHAAELVAPEHAGKATGTVNFAYSLACSLSAYTLTFTMGTFGLNAVSTWAALGALVVVVAVVTAIGYAARRNAGTEN